MTDDVCDSWEDVDPDKIVIQKSANNCNRPTYSSILTGGSGTPATNSAGFHIEHKDDKIIVGNDSVSNGTVGSVRILQRVTGGTRTNSSPDLPIFANQPNIILEDNTRTQFVKGLRILNRPSKASASAGDKAEEKLTEDQLQEKLRRIVEEKQANYSKARLRIMGEEMPDEDRVSNAMNSVNLQGQTASGTGSGSKPSSSGSQRSSSSTASIISQQQQHLVRQPMAPDGTRGFHHSQQHQ